MSSTGNYTNTSHASDWQSQYGFWVDGVVTLILVIVGVVGNVAMIVSLVATKKWIPLYYYFFTFSLWNSALLASTVFFYCLPALDERILSSNVEYTYLNILGYPVANTGMTAAIWLVLSVTVERCIVVSRPLNQITSEPRRRAKFVTAAISILAPIYNIPLFFELTVINNGTDLAKSELRDNATYKIGYRIIGNMLFLSFVPFLSIIAMSIRIIYVVQNAMDTETRKDSGGRRWPSDQTWLIKFSKIAKQDPNQNNTDNNRLSLRRCQGGNAQKNAYVTHMTLALLATKFVLCYTLPTVLNILEIILEPTSLRQAGLGFLVDISNLMVVADSAFNAFVYMSWRRKIQIQQRKLSRCHTRNLGKQIGRMQNGILTNGVILCKNASGSQNRKNSNENRKITASSLKSNAKGSPTKNGNGPQLCKNSFGDCKNAHATLCNENDSCKNANDSAYCKIDCRSDMEVIREKLDYCTAL